MTNTKEFIIILLIILLVPSLYYIVTENFMFSDYYDKSDNSLFVSITTAGDVSFDSPEIGSYYLTSRSAINPFAWIGKLFHFKKNYYLCFEKVPLALPLTEEPIKEWFTAKGYSYFYNTSWVDEGWLKEKKGQKMFREILPKYLTIKNANDINPASDAIKVKLTKQNSCNDFEKIPTLHEYKAYAIQDEFELEDLRDAGINSEKKDSELGLPTTNLSNNKDNTKKINAISQIKGASRAVLEQAVDCEKSGGMIMGGKGGGLVCDTAVSSNWSSIGACGSQQDTQWLVSYQNSDWYFTLSCANYPECSGIENIKCSRAGCIFSKNCGG